MNNHYLRAGLALGSLFFLAACNNAKPIITSLDSSSSQSQKGASRFQATSVANQEVITAGNGTKYKVQFRVGSAPMHGADSQGGYETSTPIKR